MKSFLQTTLIDKIPLARPMGIEVLNASSDCVCLKAPLEGNTNHQGTGFGGSIYSLAVLAGWGLLTAWLKECDFDGVVVIKTAAMDYRKPVTGEMRAACCFDDGDGLARLERMLATKGRGRIDLLVSVQVAGEEVAGLRGEYVIRRQGA